MTSALCKREGGGESVSAGVLLRRTLVLSNQGSTLMTSFKHNYLLVGPVSNMVTLGVRALT